MQEYKNDPSITIMKNTFFFKPVTADDISEQIKCLDINKATQERDIPTKLVKRLDNLIAHYLQDNFNSCPTKGLP